MTLLKRIVDWLNRPFKILCRHRWIKQLDSTENYAYNICVKCWKRTPKLDLYADRIPSTHRYRK